MAETTSANPYAHNVSLEVLRTAPEKAPFENMVWIPGGTFLMGSDHHYLEEAPVHSVTVSGFWMDTKLVTNAKFRKFVEETDYLTVAERVPDAAQYPGAKSGMLVPGSVVFRKPKKRVDLRNHFNWWAWEPGADWRHPEGPASHINGRENHPVLHIAFEDVGAYANWIGMQLPTEAEWEFAARGGLNGAEFAWGNEFAPAGKMMANTWLGEFPVENLNVDGHAGTSPVGSFPPNGYALYDMIGNVWEWTTDWYQHHKDVQRMCCGIVNPHGGERERSFDPAMPNVQIPRKVIKGGSYLCAMNYCQRYRPAARMAHPVDTGTCHIGFRCIVRPETNSGAGQ